MARKIQPRSKVPKPKKGQSSEEYWRERESRQRAINIRDESRTAERINEIFQSMQDSIQQEIESFYQRYADKEGITLTEARGRVSRIDMEQYERLAKKYVEAAHHGDRDTAFSQEANDQMRLYNLTMKVNRLEMLKARCGIRAMEGYRDTERLINENLEERAYSEYRRLAGILGNSVQFNENMVRAIVNASYQNATWSQRLWNHQASLSSQIGTQLASGILAGKSSTVLAREIQKLTGGSTYACQRLMRTELRRVQTEAALQSMTDNGVTEYKFMVENGVNPCDECLALDGQVFKLSDMNVGKNAPPMHPQCHCATAPYVDEAKWQRWLDGPAQAGVPWGEFEEQSVESSLMSSFIPNEKKEHINWPPPGDKISNEEFKEIRSYASDRNIVIRGVKNSDLDLSLVRDVIDKTSEMLKKYNIQRMIDHPFTLDFSTSLSRSVDFAESFPGTTHVIYFNKDAYRSAEALKREYERLESKGFFVKGTTYKSIPYHEMGHIISDLFGIDSLEIARKITGKSTPVEIREEVKKLLSDYAGKLLDGSEIIAECYSCVMSGVNNRFALKFVEECDKIILEKR